MDVLVKKVALSYAKAFVAAFVVFVPGILAAPNFTIARAAAVAALVASFDAAFKGVQVAREK